MSSNLTDEDVETIRDVLRQISGSSHSSSFSATYTPDANPSLNGYNKPPKGTKFTGRKQNYPKNTNAQPAQPQPQPVKKFNPALQHKMMRLAKMNLLGAHASTEGPLGYANKPVGSIRSATEGLSTIEQICKTGLTTDWDRVGRAPEDLVKSCLDANYIKVKSVVDITSESRIKQLISSLRLLLIELNITSDEFLTYFEEYLNMMIAEKSWISVTPSTALFMVVNSDHEETNKEDPSAWFICKKCKFCYPPQKFPCVVCGVTFRTISDLFAHNLEAHNKLVFESFQCEICGRDFGKNPVALKGHCNAEHFCKLPHLECPYGCKTLIVEENKGTLNQHLYTEHLCRICGDLFGKSVQEHQNQFHSMDKKKDLVGNPIVEALTEKKQPVQNNNQFNNRKPFVPKNKQDVKKRLGNKPGFDNKKNFKSNWYYRSRSREHSRDRKRRSRSRDSKHRERRSRSRDRSKRAKRSRSRDNDSRKRSRDSRHHSRSKSQLSKSSHDGPASVSSFENKGHDPGIEISISPPRQIYSPVSSDGEQQNESKNKMKFGFQKTVNQGAKSEHDSGSTFSVKPVSSSDKSSWLKCNDCYHKLPPPGTFNCQLCYADFEMPSSLYRHVDSAHGLPLPRSFDCEFCPETFSKSAKWDDHMYETHLCKVHKQVSLESVSTSASVSVSLSSDRDAISSSSNNVTREQPKTDFAVNVSYCTECEYSTWKGQTASEPRGGLSSGHVKCLVPECPLMFHTQQSVERHLHMDKRCAQYRLDDNLAVKHCVSCVLSMKPTRILCSYCPPEECEYTNEYELLDHILSTHFVDARMALIPTFTCDFCRRGFDDAQFGLYIAHLSREHKLCALHKFCDESLECASLFPREWNDPCKKCGTGNDVMNTSDPSPNNLTVGGSFATMAQNSISAPGNQVTDPLTDVGYFRLSSVLGYFN